MDEGTEREEDLFVPLRPLPPARMLPPALPASGGRAQARERQIAGRIGRHRDHGARPPKPARGLTRPGIVAASIAVADAEGAGAVSMRRVARELGVGAMSLYWHVESKEVLHQLMLERVQGEASAPEPSGDWRADLRSYALAARAALLRHPWAIDFIGSGPPTGPNDARNAERLLGALDGLGLSTATSVWIGMTVSTYVLGAALREVQEIRWQRAMEDIKGTMDASEVAAMSAELHRVVRDSGRYPHIAAMLDAGIDPDAPDSRRERFEFGLDCVLSGIESLLPPPARPPAAPNAAARPPAAPNAQRGTL